MPRRIAIIGAGFSGTVLAVHLLRQPVASALTVHLFERGRVMGPGLAYAARDWPYLLNVPAGRLSADSRQPLQFLHFARRTLPLADAEDFLPRELYGDYLQETLRQAEQEADPLVRLTRHFTEITAIATSDDLAAFVLQGTNGVTVQADQVVLAVGSAASPTMPWAGAVRDHPGYFHDPWRRPRQISHDKVVVIVGNGLTMADVALSLGDAAQSTPRIISISRHGLLPLPQSVFQSGGSLDSFRRTLEHATAIRPLLSAVRHASRELARQGGDWREVVTLVRHEAPSIWQRLNDAERQRFIRHLRSYWDVHRHRLPPPMSARLDSLRRTGRLEVEAGRIMDIHGNGPGLQVTWQSRVSRLRRTVDADLVVNATGPGYSVRHTPDPLLKSLRDTGRICADPLDLGLRTAADGSCVGADGTVSRNLYYLGPMLRAGHWEATAATELRDHAERLARYLAQ